MTRRSAHFYWLWPLLAFFLVTSIQAQGDEEDAFKLARNLEGGIEGWTDEGLPEDSGEYVPPKPGAGGGCL